MVWWLRFALAVVALSLTPLGSRANGPVSFSIEKVPGAEGFFPRNAPSIQAGVVALVAGDELPELAVYRVESGAASVVADSTTPIPNGNGNFERQGPGQMFGSPRIGNDRVVFYGTGADGQRGVYVQSGGSLDVVYDTSTPVPGGTGNFVMPPVGKVTASGDTLVFFGEDALSNPGLYRWRPSTSLEVVADTSTLIPGTTDHFTRFMLRPNHAGDRVVFIADGPQSVGLYTEDQSVIDVVADNTTSLPGGLAPIGFASPHGDSTRIGFWVAGFQNGGEVYLFDGNSFSLLSDHTIFDPYLILAMDQRHTLAEERLTQALWTDLGGTWTRLIGPGDALDGGVVTDIDVSDQAMSGDTIVLSIQVDGVSRGVYRAVATQPARLPPWVLVAIGGLAALLLVAYPMRSKPV